MKIKKMVLAVHQACQGIGEAWKREQIRLQYLEETKGAQHG